LKPSTRSAAAATLSLMFSVAAAAHHSFAVFDRTRTVVLTGTVKEFQWTNPHAWIQINVPDAKGRITEWGAECGSPNMMVRSGWKKSLLKPGDKVVITVNPLRDGRPNGSLITIKLANGTVLGPGNTPKLLPLGAPTAK
jgi:Family of unknown function (DUF6152)